MIVDGKPIIILGGQVNNDSAYSYQAHFVLRTDFLCTIGNPIHLLKAQNKISLKLVHNGHRFYYGRKTLVFRMNENCNVHGEGCAMIKVNFHTSRSVFCHSR